MLTAAAVVVRVPPKLMAQTRTSARTRGKSDPIDALAIARAAVREPDLPRAEHTHASRELKLLVDRREDLVARQPERILEQARVVGRAVEEGWRLRKGGNRIRMRTSVVMLKNSKGSPAGHLVVMRDLTQIDELQQARAELEAIKAQRDS